MVCRGEKGKLRAAARAQLKRTPIRATSQKEPQFSSEIMNGRRGKGTL